MTDVYSYFLYYQLEQLDESFGSYHGLGIGDVPWLDKQLTNTIITIKKCHSRVTESQYIANTCSNCGSLQGKNYVVNDPHEIMTELFHDRSMDKYLFTNLTVDNNDSELKIFFNETFKSE